MKCCGWTGPGNWSENILIKNSTQNNLYSCSCRNESLPGTEVKDVGLCENLSTDLPLYETVHNTENHFEIMSLLMKPTAVYPVFPSQFSIKCQSWHSKRYSTVYVNTFLLYYHNSATGCKILPTVPLFGS